MIDSAELVDSGLRLVDSTQREPIPPGGFHRHLKRMDDLSVGFRAPFFQLEIPNVATIEELMAEIALLTRIRNNIPNNHFSDATFIPKAIAPNTNLLFSEYIIPLIDKHALQTARSYLMINSLSYSSWVDWKSSPPIVEGIENDLFYYIVENKPLPAKVGAVYIDFPSTFYGYTIAGYRPITLTDICNLAMNNPQVIVVVDQAHLGYTPEQDVTKITGQTLIEASRHLPNLIVTNTGSKQFALRRVAWCHHSELLRENKGYGTLPHLITNDSFSIETAVATTRSEPHARVYRARVYQNKLSFEKEFRYALPFGIGEGHHVIVDATKLGFEDAQEMMYLLANGNAGVRKLGCKTCKHYGDPKRYPELLNYAYISIPFDPQVFRDLMVALHYWKYRRENF